ncbi:MAG TPA: TIGR04150 pseudo-rSAM protein [Bacteroidales bacterium]|nr:TIGR04150 pseudo-rSAM protein [Bacteroidales bacterium]
MKKFWLVLFPDTFLWIKINNGIIYNSKNFKHYTFRCSDEINKLCDTLADLDSLYSVELTELLLRDEHVKQWVDQITGIEAGCLIEQNGLNSKLTSYCPVLSIQNGMDQINWEHKQNIGGKIIENLYELVFYINGSSHGSDQYFRQTYYPVNSDKSLDFNHIESFVNQCNNKMLNHFTFVGDPISYNNSGQLQEWILSNDYFVHFVLLAEDIEKDIKKNEWFGNDKVSFTIIISNHLSFLKQPEIYHDFFDNVTFAFPVTSNAQLESITSIVQETGLNNYNIIPIYNGMNREFFEENVFMTIDEFNDIELSRREVFVNMTLNVTSFGKLTVLPDGKIYSNVNDTPLGSIGDPIYDMLYKEMTERETWFRIRDMKPCCDCVYQWLCPSPGNYELAIGKPDLCHITA